MDVNMIIACFFACFFHRNDQIKHRKMAEVKSRKFHRRRKRQKKTKNERIQRKSI